MGIAENSRFDLRTHLILQDCYMVLGRSLMSFSMRWPDAGGHQLTAQYAP